jgi:pimeloyl-ACP methyl ester carboxylesterase
MSSDEIHRTTSSDGTELAGRVLGQGPPLLLVPGALSDGEFIWGPLLPHLTERFTCYTMSHRGRGPLSGASTDVRRERLVEDVTAFADSIEEPVSCFAWSQGGLMALGAAAQTDAISALAVFEPFVPEVLPEDEFVRLIEVITQMTDDASAGRLVDASRAFVQWVSNEDEMADMAALGLFDGFASNVAAQLQEFAVISDSEAPSPTDPAELASITAPVLLLHGTRSIPGTFWPVGVRHVEAHVDEAQVRAVPGAGHSGPVCVPEAVAQEVSAFFDLALSSSS